MTLDLHTLKKIRAKVEGMKKRYGIVYDGFSSEADLSVYNAALTDLIHYLDTEIANAKGV